MALDDLADAFKEVGVPVLPPDVASQLLSLLVAHDLSEKELAELWETFTMQPGVQAGDTVPAALLQRFGAFVRAQKPVEAEEEAPSFARTPAFARTSAPAKTPGTGPPPPAPMAVQQAPAGASAFSARGARMQSAPALNGHLPEVAPAPVDAPPRCALAVEGPDEAAMGARFMRERLEDRADYIEGRLAEFAAAVVADGSADPCDALQAASGSVVRCVGRVVCEGDGRLNEASVLLEGSARHSDGHRVRLELRDLPRFALFPGQAVAVEGANPSGFCLVARRLVAGVPGPRAAPLAPSLALSLVVAAGPFTCGCDLAYEPLDELLAYCKERRPDALVLLGPFVDTEHATVSGGALDVTFDDVFTQRVCEALYTYLDSAGAGCRIVVVPSTRDAHADPVYPQPAMDSRFFGDAPAPELLLSAPNPARLRLGSLEVAATSADVLKALSGAEAARGGAPGEDRMARLASHLVGQRSFYPLYPPPQGSMLDAKRASVGLALPSAPHLLLLPSDLAPFAKVLPAGTALSEAPPQADGGDVAMADAPPANAAAPAASEADTVCVNPGRLARGSLGGTFAHVHVAAGAGAAGAPMGSSVRVDIVRV